MLGNIGGIMDEPILICILIDILVQVNRIILGMLEYIDTVMHIQGIAHGAVSILYFRPYALDNPGRACAH